MKSLVDNLNEGLLDRKLVSTETSLCAHALLLYYEFAKKHKDKIGNGLYPLDFVEATWKKLDYDVIKGKTIDQIAKGFIEDFEN